MAKRPRHLPGGRTRKVQRSLRTPANRVAPSADGAPTSVVTPAGAGAAEETAPPAPRRPEARAAVALASPTRAGAPRTGRSIRARTAAEARPRTSQLDAVAASYVHIRSDLTRIAILAAAMFLLLIALSFVIR